MRPPGKITIGEWDGRKGNRLAMGIAIESGLGVAVGAGLGAATGDLALWMGVGIGSLLER
ncbi:MAG: hypothetical protein DRP71_17660 [Verrucomicrobia bacterium]|nr:MAG: hypothetical protein DRP71_17660 [Verrucomicrobiota bacterium]